MFVQFIMAHVFIFLLFVIPTTTVHFLTVFSTLSYANIQLELHMNYFTSSDLSLSYINIRSTKVKQKKISLYLNACLITPI